MKLTAKQQRFCDEYLIDLNATQAAIRAGYSKKTANEQASRLLANVNIQQYLQKKKTKLEEKFTISQESILRELHSVVFTNIKRFYNEDGSLKRIVDLDDEAAAALAGVEVDEIWDKEYDEESGRGRRVQAGETKKIKRWDKVKAIETINKMLGYNSPEKREHEFGDGFLEFLKKTSG